MTDVPQTGQPPEDGDTAQDAGAQQPAQATMTPNTRLAHGAQPVTVPDEDGTGGEVNIGALGTIKLPSEEAQRSGFYLNKKDFSLLTSQYPRVYVRLINGGGSASSGAALTSQTSVSESDVIHVGPDVETDIAEGGESDGSTQK